MKMKLIDADKLISKIRKQPYWLDGTCLVISREAVIETIETFPEVPEVSDSRYCKNHIETNIYDKEETYENCTVQVLTNTVTGEVSIGWRRNSDEFGV